MHRRLVQSLGWGVGGMVLAMLAYAFSPAAEASFARSMAHCVLIIAMAIAGLAGCGLALSARRVIRSRRMFISCVVLGAADILLIIPILGGANVFNRPVVDRDDICRTNISTMEEALDRFYMDCGRYPTMDEGLAALELAPAWAPNWNGKYLVDIPKDPWGRNYLYIWPGIRNTEYFDLFSAGADGKPGTSDDIKNW
jgi:general secretion pathway protein G